MNSSRASDDDATLIDARILPEIARRNRVTLSLIGLHIV
jgi:hypothetical protein